MAEFREDLRGERMLISPGRAARPYDFRADAEERRRKCPFCPGREASTPPESDAERPDGSSPDSAGWTVRVVPNLYPVFPREPESAEGEAAFGLHEVIIETPDHDGCLADLPPARLADVLRVYQRRLRAARADGRLRYACLFKNRGESAGASLEHSHSQLQVLPYVPRRIAEEAEAMRQGELDRRLASELRRGGRIVRADSQILAWCPPDSRFPYETWLLPAESGQARFEDADEALVRATAGAAGDVLRALNRALDRPDYHLIVYTAPFGEESTDGLRWRVEIFPRLTKVAGFEWATGVFVNQVDPDAAAEKLRSRIADDS